MICEQHANFTSGRECPYCKIFALQDKITKLASHASVIMREVESLVDKEIHYDPFDHVIVQKLDNLKRSIQEARKL